ncbi:hypothetical protein L1987_06398 [Smallanthus sonchifolius]|uniref:Uncharacterized protein n=1 Tax=Smallanthus sonchifolius TaxID=185202 RepID=A0ACB9JXZ7_9ASTR|nr:hypothetical protein L1987_06398 [Smallanthus sonchifolius]
MGSYRLPTPPFRVPVNPRQPPAAACQPCRSTFCLRPALSYDLECQTKGPSTTGLQLKLVEIRLEYNIQGEVGEGDDVEGGNAEGENVQGENVEEILPPQGEHQAEGTRGDKDGSETQIRSEARADERETSRAQPTGARPLPSTQPGSRHESKDIRSRKKMMSIRKGVAQESESEHPRMKQKTGQEGLDEDVLNMLSEASRNESSILRSQIMALKEKDENREQGETDLDELFDFLGFQGDVGGRGGFGGDEGDKDDNDDDDEGDDNLEKDDPKVQLVGGDGNSGHDSHTNVDKGDKESNLGSSDAS